LIQSRINFPHISEEVIIFSLLLLHLPTHARLLVPCNGSAIFLVILDNFDISLDVVNDLGTIFAGSKLESSNLLFDELGQLQYFNVLNFICFVMSDDSLFLLSVELLLKLLV